MSTLTVDVVKKALLDAGFEVFRAKGETIQLAERVRSHLMDANVAVCVGGSATVSFTVRGQRSDYPTDTDEALFQRIRGATADKARARAFAESGAASRQIQDPVDETRVLDVWHELTFSKPTTQLDELVADVQFALSLPKCVTP